MTDNDIPDEVVAELYASITEDARFDPNWSTCGPAASPGDTLRSRTAPAFTMPQVSKKRVAPIGERFPDADYTLLRVLGEGGMGVVFEAEQHYLRRRVALKIIRPERMRDGTTLADFYYEAAVSANLDHPGIVPILDFGVSQDGRALYAMKQTGGAPWSRTIRSLSLQENIALLARVADVVAYAHSRGVLHRDLKPGNIMLGEYGEVWVGDWGVAVAKNRNGDFSHAYPGGTPWYMAPEAAACRFPQLDERSDVYLLGGILFEILNGYPPHPGDTPAASLECAAANTLRKADCDHDLIHVAFRALNAEPGRRFSSAHEFKKAVRSCLDATEVDECVRKGKASLPQADEVGEYELYTRAIAFFDQALAIQPENKEAESNKMGAVAAYADAAGKSGEYALAASILQPYMHDSAFRKQAARIGAMAKKTTKRRRNIRAAAWGGVVVLLIGLCVTSVQCYLRIPEPHSMSLEYRLSNEYINSEEMKRHLVTYTINCLISFDTMVFNHGQYFSETASKEPLMRLDFLIGELHNSIRHPDPDDSDRRALCRRATEMRKDLRQIYGELQIAGKVEKDKSQVRRFLTQFERLLLHLDAYARRFPENQENG